MHFAKHIECNSQYRQPIPEYAFSTLITVLIWRDPCKDFKVSKNLGAHPVLLKFFRPIYDIVVVFLKHQCKSLGERRKTST